MDETIIEIEKNLYLSTSTQANDINKLKAKQIKYVLSVFDDNLRHKSEDITYKKIEAFDDEKQDLLTYFPETNEFIAKAQECNQNVLVHCHAGISRSPTVILAFIMNKYKKTYDSARKSVRCYIDPNEGFVSQLRLYEEMRFTLNGNNKQLRKHLMTNIRPKIPWIQDVNTIGKYFKRREFVESLTPNLNLGNRCLCAKCGHHLFNEIHILPTNVSSDSENECSWTYIEPLRWMEEVLIIPFQQMNEFEVKCKCGEQLIEFHKLFDPYLCGCCLHSGLPEECLIFQIENKKFKIKSNICCFI